MKKKILSLVLVLTLVAGCFSVFAEYDPAKDIPTNIIYRNEYNFKTVDGETKVYLSCDQYWLWTVPEEVYIDFTTRDAHVDFGKVTIEHPVLSDNRLITIAIDEVSDLQLRGMKKAFINTETGEYVSAKPTKKKQGMVYTADDAAEYGVTEGEPVLDPNTHLQLEEEVDLDDEELKEVEKKYLPVQISEDSDEWEHLSAENKAKFVDDTDANEDKITDWDIKLKKYTFKEGKTAADLIMTNTGKNKQMQAIDFNGYLGYKYEEDGAEKEVYFDEYEKANWESLNEGKTLEPLMVDEIELNGGMPVVDTDPATGYNPKNPDTWKPKKTGAKLPWKFPMLDKKSKAANDALFDVEWVPVGEDKPILLAARSNVPTAADKKHALGEFYKITGYVNPAYGTLTANTNNYLYYDLIGTSTTADKLQGLTDVQIATTVGGDDNMTYYCFGTPSYMGVYEGSVTYKMDGTKNDLPYYGVVEAEPEEEPTLPDDE